MNLAVQVCTGTVFYPYANEVGIYTKSCFLHTFGEHGGHFKYSPVSIGAHHWKWFRWIPYMALTWQWT